MKGISLRKAVSLVLTIVMVFGGLGLVGIDVEGAYASGKESDNNAYKAKESLIKAVDYYFNVQHGILSDWEELLAIYGANILEDSDMDMQEWVLTEDPKPYDSPKAYLPIIITSLIKGNDPTEYIAGADGLSMYCKDGIFSEHSDVQAFGMLSMDVAQNAGITLPENYNGLSAAKYLMNLRDSETGGFRGEYDGNIQSIDSTGYVAITLANYAENEEVRDSIYGIVDFLEIEQLENGGFKYSYEAGPGYDAGSYESANSTALAILGLSAIKLAVNDEELQMRINSIVDKALDALIKWQNKDGSFGFDPTGNGSFDSYTSKQAMLALCSIANNANIFKQINKNETELINLYVTIESDKHNPVITHISAGKGEELSKAGEKAWRKSKIDKDFIADNYIYNIDDKADVSSSAVISKDMKTLLLIDKDVLRRAVFTEKELSGEKNNPQLVTLNDKENGQPLPGVAITIDDDYVGYDFSTLPKLPLTTDEKGQLMIPGERFPQAGDYHVSTSSVGVSKDLCIITITEGDTSPGTGQRPSNDNKAKKDYVKLHVIGHDGKYAYDIYSKNRIEIVNGDTPYSILKKAGLELEGNSSYISSINGLREKEYTPFSGWKYSVNGEYLSSSAGSYLLKDGDEVSWRYVLATNEFEEPSHQGTGEEEFDFEDATQIAIMRFEDVDINDWFAASVGYMVGRGIISGKTEKMFMPDDSVTRAEFTMILAKMAEADLSKYAFSGFNDVSEEDWFANAVRWAKEMGIVSGFIMEDGEPVFKPNNKITRQDMAVMINNYAEKIEKKTMQNAKENSTVKDIEQIAPYASSAVKIMLQSGIIRGIESHDGTFNFLPFNNATRAEAVQMISAYIQNISF